jgi:hypothetical protein
MDIIAPATSPRPHVLVVADWRTDAYGVMSAIRRRAAEGDATFALLVSAWLHGLDWAGDPSSSRPCAERALDKLSRIASRDRVRRAHPLDLSHRLHRLTGIPVHAPVPRLRTAPERHFWSALAGGGHCAPAGAGARAI